MNLSIMIKPASSLCNLQCRYCFYHDIAENREVASYGVMREAVLDRLLERAFEALPPGRNRLSLIFQGGEPMLAGLDFFPEIGGQARADDAGRLGGQPQRADERHADRRGLGGPIRISICWASR